MNLWKEIIGAVRSKLTFLALLVLSAQAIIVTAVAKLDGWQVFFIAVASTVLLVIPVIAVSRSFLSHGEGDRPLDKAPPSPDQIKTSPKTSGLRLFVTTPMSTYKTDKEYSIAFNDAMIVVNKLRSMDEIDNVYYFNENFPTLEGFEKADLSVPMYIDEIERCDYFIAILTKKQFSSVYYECGISVAKGKKNIWFVKGRGCLPFLMNLSAYANPDSIRVYDYDTIGEIAKLLSNKETFFSEN